ncbi:MAG TPA: insulinase family protein, partial [Firmicutes bacterium]|nr:insulinase family protein [Bacillota bacterium]
MKTHPHFSVRKGLFLAVLILSTTLCCPLTIWGSSTRRVDPLVVSKLDPISKEENYEYVTMILKTGYGHEPSEKRGLNTLTNELVYLLLRNTRALEVNYYPFAEYTIFTFVVWRDDFAAFCAELDALIRLDTLLLYDLCNELINQHIHTAKTPFVTGQSILYELLYGPDHPYLNRFKADYSKLDINEVNTWFREIYKPNNIVISTTSELPEDFLKKPSGRDLQKRVLNPEIPPSLATDPVYRFTDARAPVSTIFIAFPGPKPEEDGFFVSRIIQKYLQHQLWSRLRQERGYCYDLQVSYSYLNEPTAPNITIAFQVLPENTEPAIYEVFNLLEELEREPLTPEEIRYFVELEEKSQDKNYSTPSFLSLMDAIG